MANSQKDDNGSQFFFTLGNTSELNKKHTLFGKISDNTIFNMIKINEFEVIDERPTRPVRIISTEVFKCFFLGKFNILYERISLLCEICFEMKYNWYETFCQEINDG